MSYVAHRLLGLFVLTGALVFAGCKSAETAPAETDSQTVEIPTPEPEVMVDSDTATLNSPSVTVDGGEVSNDVQEPQSDPMPAAEPKSEPAPAVAVVEPTPAPAAVATVEPTPAPESTPEPMPAAPVEPQIQAEPQTPAIAPLWSLKYPGDKQQFAGDLSMTVVQDRKSIKITNRTVTSFNDVQVWINQRYVTRVTDIPVGKTTSVALKTFINQYGEKYPTPGLFRPDRSFPALLVEIYESDQNKRYRLIVQKTHSQF